MLKRINPALKTTGVYLVAGFLWILLSDRLLQALNPSPEVLSVLQTSKGWFFVLVSGLLLFALLNRYFRASAESNDALMEQHRVLNTLLSNLPGMAYRCANDADWTMKFLSEGCRPLTGHPRSALLDNDSFSYNDLIHPEDRQMVWDRVQAAVVRDEPFRLVYRIRTESGAEKWVWEQGRAVPGPDGEPPALEGFISDISELKLLEFQLRQAQKMEAVGRLAGGVAHDFNNLLTAIGGYAALLKRRVAGDQVSESELDEIRKAVEKGGNLTRQLLTFSRRQILRTEILNLNTVVVDLERLLRRLIGDAILLEVALNDSDSWVRADRGQIEQVAVNLAVNARDAMPEGGTIRLEVSSRTLSAGEDGEIELEPGEYHLLAVSDAGTGMSEEVVGRIFEPFFTTKDPGKGTGLGLSTVYGIVKQSGGDIRVATRPGEGSTFTVYLPAKDPSADSESGITRRSSAPARAGA